MHCDECLRDCERVWITIPTNTEKPKACDTCKEIRDKNRPKDWKFSLLNDS